MFIAGLILGGIIGVAVMAIMIVGRDAEDGA